jgi:hypothetical protein
MIYGLPKVSQSKERRMTILLLLVYAAIAAILFYNEQQRENIAESNGRRLNTTSATPKTFSPS